MGLKEIKKLCIIAGAGKLPQHVLEACKARDIDVCVIGLDGYTQIDLEGVEHQLIKAHAVSKILKALKNFGATHVTFAGKVSRVDIPKLVLDLKGAKLLASILMSGLSDSELLNTVINFIEKEGFSVVAPDKIATHIVLSKGVNTNAKPTDAVMKDIKVGVKILRGVAEFDVGQALVIQSGLVLGVEAAEGTNELIKRCGQIKQSGDGPLLIKMCKPNQDRRIDLPCIGPETVQMAYEYGFAGIAAEHAVTLVMEYDETLKLANKYKMFLYGF